MKLKVITGYLKHKNIFAPSGKYKIRATTSFVKKAIIDILQKKIEQGVVLDLFAGTGNIGIEFLSNGAKKVVFIENNFHNIAMIKKNLKNLNIPLDNYFVIHNQVERSFPLLENRFKFDYIFLDPPYRENLINTTIEALSHYKIYHNKTIIIAEHSIKETTSEQINTFQKFDSRKYGSTMLDFYTPELLSF